MVAVVKNILLAVLAAGGFVGVTLAQITNIVGGEPASHSEFPYFVSLRRNFCGGTLVHPDIVVSAAHCSNLANQLTVGPSRQPATSSYYENHPNYNAGTKENDIMVIKLDQRFDGVALANINRDFNLPADNQQLVVMGYGATAEGGGISTVFNKVTVNAISYSSCNANYNGIVYEATMFCAGVPGGGQDSCQGDSGGPLVIGNTLVGIVSFGIGCARERFPGVNARVSSAAGWIDDRICCLSSARPSGCTCSTDPENPADNGGGGGGGGGSCFSGDSKVHVHVRGEVAMKDLKVGDKVMTASNKWESVFAFGHYHDTVKTTFIKLFVKSGDGHETLEVTGSHLIYVHGRVNPVRADSVKVGDSLTGTNNTQLVVTKIGWATKRGIYAPLTPSGKIVVNSILASNYISAQEDASEYAHVGGKPLKLIAQHNVSHMWMAPFRLLCGTTGSTPLNYCTSLNEHGLLQYASIGYQFVEWGISQSTWVQIPCFLGTMVVLSLFAFVESALSIPLAYLLLFASGGMLAYLARGIHASFSLGTGSRLKTS